MVWGGFGCFGVFWGDSMDRPSVVLSDINFYKSICVLKKTDQKRSGCPNPGSLYRRKKKNCCMYVCLSCSFIQSVVCKKNLYTRKGP